MTAAPPFRTAELEARIPGLASAAPRLLLATLPTPVHSQDALAAQYGLASLHVKRDDLTSAHCGGAKLRGLEFFLGRAVREGRGVVETMGSEGSNHVVATATFARAAGLRARLVLFPFPDRVYADANVAHLRALGAEVLRGGWVGLLPALLRARARSAGSRPLWIAPGGSSGIGVLGAVEAALELASDVRLGRVPMPDDVVVAAGSCGTAAGILLGLAIAGMPARVVAVRVVPRLVASRRRILLLFGKGLAELKAAGYADLVSPGPLSVIHGEVGKGYGWPTDAGRAAVAAAVGAGIPAETTYTGKAWAHVFGTSLRGRKVVFWNTFGATIRRTGVAAV